MAKHAASGSFDDSAYDAREELRGADDAGDEADLAFSASDDDADEGMADGEPAPCDECATDGEGELLEVAALDEGSARGDEFETRRGAAAPYADAFAHDMGKSRRTRRVLIAIIVVALVAIVGLAAGVAYVTLTGTPSPETEQNSAADRLALGDGDTVDAGSQAESKTEVPSIVSVVGSTQDEALSAIGHGAAATSSRDVEEEGSSVKRIVTVALADEPVDTRTGAPTVYLSLDEAGTIVQVSYSVGLSLLGYGSISFVDAVESGRVVDTVLEQAGIAGVSGAVSLPENAAEYTTMSSDGKEKVKESFAFAGETQCKGEACAWTATLSYDYTGSNASGAISDVVRRITVTVTSPAAYAVSEESEG